jgi:hypothetical protein
MSLDEVLQMARRQPFRPFRLYVSDGSAYEVRHPDLLMPGARSVIVGVALDPGQTYYDRHVVIDLIHITRLEPMEPQPAGDGAASA